MAVEVHGGAGRVGVTMIRIHCVHETVLTHCPYSSWTHLWMYPSTHHLSIDLLNNYPPIIHPSVHPPITHPSIYLSFIYLSICPSIYLMACPSIHPSVYPPPNAKLSKKRRRVNSLYKLWVKSLCFPPSLLPLSLFTTKGPTVLYMTTLGHNTLISLQQEEEKTKKIMEKRLWLHWGQWTGNDHLISLMVISLYEPSIRIQRTLWCLDTCTT